MDAPDLSYDSADREHYYAFYRRLLDLCHAAEAENCGLTIQNFTQGLARILNARGDDRISYAEEASAPLKSLNVDSRGNITTFYAGLAPEAHRDQYGDGQGLCLGNIFDMSLEEMIRSAKLQKIINDFAVSRRACRRECAYFPVCAGGFELTKLAAHGRFDGTETAECIIHTKALTDALLDDVTKHLERKGPSLGRHGMGSSSSADVLAPG